MSRREDSSRHFVCYMTLLAQPSAIKFRHESRRTDHHMRTTAIASPFLLPFLCTAPRATSPLRMLLEGNQRQHLIVPDVAHIWPKTVVAAYRYRTITIPGTLMEGLITRSAKFDTAKKVSRSMGGDPSWCCDTHLTTDDWTKEEKDSAISRFI